MSAGRFITFEGGEGAGKSTQVLLLAEHLRQRGCDVVCTREPGGSVGAEQIRSVLVSGEPGRWDGMTEALLHYAARRDHLRATVWPALAAGKWVISDRFADSTLAYQGYGHGVAKDLLQQLYRMVAGDFAPHMTVLLDLPVATGLARAVRRGGGEDRYEQMEIAFHQRLRDGFLEIASADPARCRVVAADRAPDLIAAEISGLIAARWP